MQSSCNTYTRNIMSLSLVIVRVQCMQMLTKHADSEGNDPHELWISRSSTLGIDGH